MAQTRTVPKKLSSEDEAIIKADDNGKKALKAFQDDDNFDLNAIISQFGGTVVEVKDVVGEIPLIDAEELVGTAFTVVHWVDRSSDEYGRYNDEGILEPSHYVSVYVYTDDKRKLVFNDGGVGIKQTLQDFLLQTGQLMGLRCPFGLRVSEYEKVIDGKKATAKTLYFATSKPKKS